MKKLDTFLVGGIIVAVVLGVIGILPTFGAGIERTRKIVVFKDDSLNDAAREALVGVFGGEKIKDLHSIHGQAANLPEAGVAALRHDPRVLRVDDDAIVEAQENKNVLTIQSQVLPWGIDRVDADLVWGTTTADPVKVGVIDTGIELNHPDLAANIKGGYNAINPARSANDDNGHGTHVAGIIAALDNTQGVVGMAPRADLYAIKVLSASGSGYTSDVIEGIDWAVAHGMKVVNLSLGSSSDVVSLHDAVIRARLAGMTVVAAAGNSGGPVIYPAAYPEVIAVAATDSNDLVASWSSRGSEVDLAAPGVNIYSSYKGKTYKYLSGTSMATPHVAGAVALLSTVTAKCDTDLNGVCDPVEIQNRLEGTARDLGAPGRDDLYGAGLLNVGAAILGQ